MRLELVKREYTQEHILTYFHTDLTVESDDLRDLTADIKKAIAEPLQLIGQGEIHLLYSPATATYTVLIAESTKVPYIHRLCRKFEV